MTNNPSLDVNYTLFYLTNRNKSTPEKRAGQADKNPKKTGKCKENCGLLSMKVKKREEGSKA